jgi:hypothetical protein
MVPDPEHECLEHSSTAAGWPEGRSTWMYGVIEPSEASVRLC